MRTARWCAVFLAYTAHGVALDGAMCEPVVCDPESHAFVGVSRLSSSAAELDALMFAVRGISVAVQLEKEVLPLLDASFVSDNWYALGIMQFLTRAVTNHAQAQLARRTCFQTGTAMCVPIQGWRATNLQTWVSSWPGGFVMALGGPFFEGGGSPVLPLRCSLVDGSGWQA